MPHSVYGQILDLNVLGREKQHLQGGGHDGALGDRRIQVCHGVIWRALVKGRETLSIWRRDKVS